jgi:hypothetical protein
MPLEIRGICLYAPPVVLASEGGARIYCSGSKVHCNPTAGRDWRLLVSTAANVNILYISTGKLQKLAYK